MEVVGVEERAVQLGERPAERVSETGKARPRIVRRGLDNVPDEFLTPVSIFIADALLAQYGIPHGSEADPGSWNARIARTTDEMRIMRAMRPTYGVLQVNYF